LFGPHLIIDGNKCDTAKLGDRLLIERILTDYPRAIGMTRIGGPYMFEYQAPDPAYSGVSGLVVIAESHIAIHTFPALDYFTMDIFSCKNFDHEVAIDYIRQALGVQAMDRMLVQRGLSFRGPHHGPLGATDELIAAAEARNHGLGVTIGTIPTDDPLYPREGKMLWPAYGQTPDYGDSAVALGGVRGDALVRPANAAAAGDLAPAGLLPVQPLQLNPTASTSGVLDRLAALGGTGRMVGKALTQWEGFVRAGMPVALALGPQTVADGLRDLVADLLHRGHIAAVMLEGDALLADAYESLGYRHYVRAEDEAAPPLRATEEWDAARPQIAALLADAPTRAGTALARHLGVALGQQAPRPGILAAAAHLGIPVFLTGDTGLALLGVRDPLATADRTALRAALDGAGLIACGTTAATAESLAATKITPHLVALGCAPIAGAQIVCTADAALALPLVATGLVQRIPTRPRLVVPDVLAVEHAALLPVG
jgi:S-adenosylmethionine decarboxylase